MNNYKSESGIFNNDQYNEYDKYDIKSETQYVLEDALENMNEYIKNNIPKKLSEIIIKKCNETGCYLFLFKLEKLEEL